jgi:hypothetical protein
VIRVGVSSRLAGSGQRVVCERYTELATFAGVELMYVAGQVATDASRAHARKLARATRTDKKRTLVKQTSRASFAQIPSPRLTNSPSARYYEQSIGTSSQQDWKQVNGRAGQGKQEKEPTGKEPT